LRWTCKPTRQLAQALTAQGHPVSDDTVGRLLRQQGYTLQRPLKTEEGAQHPDRDAQFRYLNEQAKQDLAAGQPVISVDTKKKELVGRFANTGGSGNRPARPSGSTCTTSPRTRLARRSLWGVRPGRNAGWVSVGTDHGTAAFAVATIRRW
jgi:Rhodopirellula transposase DDE domain